METAQKKVLVQEILLNKLIHIHFNNRIKYLIMEVLIIV
jgi:hypothetical protein